MAEELQAVRDQLEALRLEVAAAGVQRDAIERIANAVQPRAPMIKPPKFTGREDIRQFLETFDTVRETNQWNDGAAALRLKLALEGTAKVGVSGNTLEEIRNSLLQKYELTQDEARSALRALRLKTGESVHELGENTLRLVSLAHPNIGDEQRREEAILCLVEAVGDRYLKHEFRLQPPDTFEQALNRIRDYQRDMGRGDRRLIQRVEMEEEGKVTELEKQVASLQQQVVEIGRRQEKTDEALTGYAASTQDKLDQLLARATRQQPTSSRRPVSSVTCYECGETGHFKRNCPKLATTATSADPGRQGNGTGPSA